MGGEFRHYLVTGYGSVAARAGFVDTLTRTEISIRLTVRHFSPMKTIFNNCSAAYRHASPACRPAGGAAISPNSLGFRHTCAVLLALLICATASRAQWVTEPYPLLPGWNGIWVSQDCTHETLDDLLAGSPGIEEVWLWNPVGGAGKFATSPAVPLAQDVAWQVWRRGNPAGTTLTRMLPGSAYLVKVTGSGFTLSLTGRPVPPRYSLARSGRNLVGFPMLTPDSSSERSIEQFFSFDSVLKFNPPVYTYRGGALSAVNPKNPVFIGTPRTTALSRGKAYWLNTNDQTRYYGPVEVTVLGSTLDFGAALSAVTVRLRNAIDPAKNLGVTATLAPAPSATPPAGQAPIAGPVPLLVRGPRDAATLDFTYTPLGSGLSRTLGPGEQTEVTLALDRPAMGSATGAVFQSLLQVSDSLNLTRIDLGVRAEVPSFTGLWIGSAVVTAVDQTIGQSTVANAAAPSAFPIRLILHRTDAGGVTMLQQVYVGAAGEAMIAGASEALVTTASTGKVARFSTASFPPGNTWAGTGGIGLSGTLSFNVPLGYNAPTNPFLHTYHPDHDNLDPRFETLLPAGVESPNITRAVTLTFTPTLPGVTDNGIGSTTLGGTYQETITGLRATPVSVSGAFVLRRIAAVPSLLTGGP